MSPQSRVTTNYFKINGLNANSGADFAKTAKILSSTQNMPIIYTYKN